MSDAYKLYEIDKAYFLTMTIVGWIDVFTKKIYRLKIVESLKYCQKNKGLEIFCWCLMPNHVHLIARAGGKYSLSEIFRDFKKFTSKGIIQQIIDQPDSRHKWMLNQFEFNGRYLKRVEKFKFWQDGNHAEIIYTPNFFYEKLDYIHNNPVKELFVSKPEDYLFSSARNYAGLEYVLDVICETTKIKTIR